MDSSLKFTTFEPDGWSVDSGFGAQHYYDGDSAKSKEGMGYDYECWMQAIVDSDTAETLKFWWKADCELHTDYLEFYIDGEFKDRITDQTVWAQKEYTIPVGIHTLKWRYMKDSTIEDDCGWVDCVEWSGANSVLVELDRLRLVSV